MEKMKFVKKEFEKAYKARLIEININNSSSYNEIKLNNEMIAYIDENGLVFYYPYEAKNFKFILENDDVKALQSKFNTNKIYDAITLDKIFDKFIYLNNIIWKKQEGTKGLKKVAIQILVLMYNIAFFKEHEKKLLKLGFKKEKISKSIEYSEKIYRINGNNINMYFKPNKMFKKLKKLIKNVYYNLDIIQNYPNKLKELKDIEFNYQDFRYKDTIEIKEDKEGC